VYAGLVYIVSDDVRLLSTAAQLQWTERNSTLALSDVIRRQWNPGVTSSDVRGTPGVTVTS